VEKTEGKGPLGRPGVNESIILRWIFKKWTEFFWLRTEADDGLF